MLLLMENTRSQYRRQRLAPRPTSIVGANHWPRGAARGRARPGSAGAAPPRSRGAPGRERGSGGRRPGNTP